MGEAFDPEAEDRIRRKAFALGQLLQGLVMGPLLFAALAALFASQSATFVYQGY